MLLLLCCAAIRVLYVCQRDAAELFLQSIVLLGRGRAVLWLRTETQTDRNLNFNKQRNFVAVFSSIIRSISSTAAVKKTIKITNKLLLLCFDYYVSYVCVDETSSFLAACCCRLFSIQGGVEGVSYYINNSRRRIESRSAKKVNHAGSNPPELPPSCWLLVVLVGTEGTSLFFSCSSLLCVKK